MTPALSPSKVRALVRSSSGSLICLVLGLCVAAASNSFAQEQRSIEGMGRIAIQGGYRWTPNATFVQQAKDKGYTLAGPMRGGGQLSASFGYAPLDWIEASIDLFLGIESFQFHGFAGDDPSGFTSTSYGALIGVRIEKMDFPLHGLLPYFGAQFGPSLALISSRSVTCTIEKPCEKLNTGFAFNAGLTYRFADKWGVGFDVRYLFSDGAIPDPPLSFNAGGLWISLTLTFFIGAGPKDPMGGML